MRALLYGSSAVGIAIAAALIDSRWTVDIKASGKTREAIKAYGMKRTGLFRELSIPPDQITLFDALGEMPPSAYDYILVCTKAMFNDTVSKDLYTHQQILKPQGKIVLFQNGWGTDEPYLRYFDTARVYHARVITGFTRPKRHISEVTAHASAILIGSLHHQPIDSMKALASAINHGGLPCEVTEEIEKALWAKMLFNCTLNPLGAVLGVNYGNLTESENAKHIMDRMIEEVFTVMHAGGFHTYWENAAEYKEVFYNELIPPTYHHRSSTLQDIEKRVQTEIDVITGSIVRLGSQYGVDVPYHTMMLNLIKTMESFF